MGDGREANVPTVFFVPKNRFSGYGFEEGQKTFGVKVGEMGICIRTGVLISP